MSSCLPDVKPKGEWLSANQGFYAKFLAWLREGGYSGSTLAQYAMGARLVFGLLDQPYWMLDLDAEEGRVRAYLESHVPSEPSRGAYLKGMAKLAQFLHQSQHRAVVPRKINWDYHLAGVPSWLADAFRAHLAHQARGWMPELAHQNAVGLLTRLAPFLRWAASRYPLCSPSDLTPDVWYAFVDDQLAAGIKPGTINGRLQLLQQVLLHLSEEGEQVNERMLRVDALPTPEAFPRDVPLESLRRLRAEIEREASSAHFGKRRMGILDRAWFLVMLHSGLRTSEVRRLTRADLDFERKTIRIEQSRGLKDRVVYMSSEVIEVLNDYLEVRGPSETDYVFLYRHQPLSKPYCAMRLRTYARRCGVRITPHQLRHSCATLLLNAGAPVLTVKTILGHRHVTTILGYARLYDGTVAADYYRAMAEVERKLELAHGQSCILPATGRMLALVDSLSSGTLNDAQRRTVQALRAVVVEMIEHEAAPA